MITPTKYRDMICELRFSTFTRGKNFDGRAEWQPMKNKLSDEAVACGWNSCIQNEERIQFYHDVMALGEFNKDGSMNETHHFLIQCVRIPIVDKMSARKIYQIALNIGQLEAEFRLGQIQGNVLELYKRFRSMGMYNIDEYM